MVESAGLLVYRKQKDEVEVLLTHPGGPIWGKRDVWSIPKGEVDDGEEHQAAAFREFQEEVGIEPPTGELIDLGSAPQGSPTRKVNYMWAVAGNPDIANFSSNTFTMQWPPKSGQTQEFPENDRAAWYELGHAVLVLFPDQVIFIERLASHLGVVVPEKPQQQALL